MNDTVEVRLLGSLSVRRVDGSFVESREWRTGKTAQLLRLLALAGRRAVPVPVLLDRLWPDASEDRARASLRTAASQVRRTIGVDCVERSPDGLSLTDVWVDAVAFHDLAREVRLLSARRAHHQVVALAREGVVLYAGDLIEERGSDDQWLAAARDQLALEHLQLLDGAAASAGALGWFAEAADFAHAALECDPLDEPAHRALMSAYHGLGDPVRALRVYEDLRARLADELGVTPSAATRTLHLEILCGGVQPAPGAARVGPHPHQVDELLGLVDDTSCRRAAVALEGPEGVGRCEVAAATVRRLAALGWRVVPALPGQDLERDSQEWRGDDRTLVLLAERDVAAAAVAAALDLPGSRGTVVALLPRPEAATTVTGLRETGYPVRVMRVAPLSREEVRAVVERALRASLGDHALDCLLASTRGELTRVDELVARWVAEGRLRADRGRMELVDESGPARSLAAATAVIHELPLADLDVAATLAVAHGPVTARDVDAGLFGARSEADVRLTARCLDHLIDRDILVRDGEGYSFRDPVTRDVAKSWLRPTRRHLLLRHFARCETLSPEARARHWMRLGEAENALELLMAEAQAAERSGLPERAQHLLTYGSRLAAAHAARSDRGRRLVVQTGSALQRIVDGSERPGGRDGKRWLAAAEDAPWAALASVFAPDLERIGMRHSAELNAS